MYVQNFLKKPKTDNNAKKATLVAYNHLRMFSNEYIQKQKLIEVRHRTLTWRETSVLQVFSTYVIWKSIYKKINKKQKEPATRHLVKRSYAQLPPSPFSPSALSPTPPDSPSSPPSEDPKDPFMSTRFSDPQGLSTSSVFLPFRVQQFDKRLSSTNWIWVLKDKQDGIFYRTNLITLFNVVGKFKNNLKELSYLAPHVLFHFQYVFVIVGFGANVEGHVSVFVLFILEQFNLAFELFP